MGSNRTGRFSQSGNFWIALLPRCLGTTLGDREIDRKRRCGPLAQDALVRRSHDQRTHARPCNHWCCKFLNTSAIEDIEKECSSLFIVNVARAPTRRALFFTGRQDHSVELPHYLQRQFLVRRIIDTASRSVPDGSRVIERLRHPT